MPGPGATVTYTSRGGVLIVGPLDQAQTLAASLSDVLQVTLFAQGGAGAQAREHAVLAGRIDHITGWLGAFELAWTQSNPIDPDPVPYTPLPLPTNRTVEVSVGAG